MKLSFLSPKRERRSSGDHRSRSRRVSALTIGALLSTSLASLTVGHAFADTPSTSADTSASESVNLSLQPGAVASAKSQRMT